MCSDWFWSGASVFLSPIVSCSGTTAFSTPTDTCSIIGSEHPWRHTSVPPFPADCAAIDI